MNRFSLLILLLFCCKPGYNQTALERQIDSLKNELRKELPDLEKAKIYGDLSWYYNTVSVDSAYHYGTQALEMARQLQDRKLIAQSLSDMGAIYFVKGEIDQALAHYEESREVREADGDLEGIASLDFKIGAVYYRKMDLEKSMKYYLESLQYYEQAKNESVIANLHSNIAVVYTALRNYPKALDFLKKGEAYFEANNMDAQLANNTLATGNVLVSLQDTTGAIDYYKKTLEIAGRSGHFIAEAAAYNNLGSIYTELGDHRLAISYVKKALEIRNREKLESDAASANITLAINHTRLGDYHQAKTLLLHSLAHFEKTGFSEKLGTVYFQLIAAYAGLSKMDSVFHYMNLFVQNASNVLDEKVIEVSNELETKYQTEKKEQQIELLNQETAMQQLQLRNRNLLLLAALILLLAGGFAAYMIFKQRRLKAAARLQQEINRQQEQATRAVLDAEENERRRIAGDLHDGVGQILSAALLNLKFMNKGLKEGKPVDTAIVDDAIHLVENSYDEMRSISHQMMPNALVKSGLVSAVREFVNQIDSRVLNISLSVSGLDDRLDGQTETVLYRVIQESVNNVIKHSQASHLSIQLANDAEGTTLAIEDNGIGFDTAAIDWNSSGLGLQNMRSRLEILKGAMEIDSHPGRGTLITIFVP